MKADILVKALEEISKEFLHCKGWDAHKEAVYKRAENALKEYNDVPSDSMQWVKAENQANLKHSYYVKTKRDDGTIAKKMATFFGKLDELPDGWLIDDSYLDEKVIEWLHEPNP